MHDSTVKRALVAGHLCLDLFPDLSHIPPGSFEQHFQPGHLVTAGGLIFSTGGPVSNVGLALHRLGVPTTLAARLGADRFGEIARDIITSYDLELASGIIIDPDNPTSYTIVISPPDVDRIFIHCPGVNDFFNASDISLDLYAQADLLHFGYPPVMRQMYTQGGHELMRVFQCAKASGLTTSLDMTFPDPTSEGGRADWRAILPATLLYIDIFLPSFEEILFMLRRSTYEMLRSKHNHLLDGLSPELVADLADELLQMGVRVVVLKLGRHGLYLKTASDCSAGNCGRAAPPDLQAWAGLECWAPCYQVEVAGTTGAGDATIAGFLSAFLRGLSPQQALDAAVAVGACNVEAPDALSGLRSWPDTLKRLEQDWPKHDLAFTLEDWDWDTRHRLWQRRS